MRLFGNTTKKANDKDNAKIKMVEVSQLRFDRDFKNVFQQENDKVAEIANDMRTNGFDKSRPIIVTAAYIIVDGHSRFMAAKKAGLEKVPVIIKKFDSRDETIEYEYKMQLNSRRLTDGEYFAAFLKLDEIKLQILMRKGLLMRQLAVSLISLLARFVRCVRLLRRRMLHFWRRFRTEAFP